MKEHIKMTSLKAYTWAYLSCIALTLVAYFLVEEKLYSGTAMVLTLIALATAQTIIQLIFFLYLGKERKPRLNLITFWFMALVLVVIVGGSLWIMYSLNHRVMLGTM